MSKGLSEHLSRVSNGMGLKAARPSCCHRHYGNSDPGGWVWVCLTELEMTPPALLHAYILSATKQAF